MRVKQPISDFGESIRVFIQVRNANRKPHKEYWLPIKIKK